MVTIQVPLQEHSPIVNSVPKIVPCQLELGRRDRARCADVLVPSAPPTVLLKDRKDLRDAETRNQEPNIIAGSAPIIRAAALALRFTLLVVLGAKWAAATLASTKMWCLDIVPAA